MHIYTQTDKTGKHKKRPLNSNAIYLVSLKISFISWNVNIVLSFHTLV